MTSAVSSVRAPLTEAALDDLAERCAGALSSLRFEIARALGEDPSILESATALRWMRRRFDEHRGQARSIVVLSDATVHALSAPLATWLQVEGVAAEVVARAEYHWPAAARWVVEHLRAKNDSAPAVIVALFDLEKLLPDPFELPERFSCEIAARIDLLRQAASEAGARLIVGDLRCAWPSMSPVFCQVELSRERVTADANEALRRCLAERGVERAETERWLSACAAHARCNVASYAHHDALLTPSSANALARMLARQIAAKVVARRKVLVLDLDNTLWRGVVGEAGPEGVEWRGDTGEGRGYRHAHRALRALGRTGILLAICSKNNESDVDALMDRSDFELPRGCFSARRINWLSKVDNLRSIAEELDLSLDSFVFLDDSDAECAAVRAALPEVLTVQAPRSSAALCELLGWLSCFDCPKITESDRVRTVEYQRQAQRREARAQFADDSQFLDSLAMVVRVDPPRPAQLARAAQLFERTNQFNTSGLRPSVEALSARLAADPSSLWLVEYRDRFGDSGVVGALLCRRAARAVVVEGLVLSCRVLGRGVERRVHDALVRALGTSIRYEFRDSGRNAPALAFVRSLSATDADTQGELAER
jgi:FkbH-like protein